MRKVAAFIFFPRKHKIAASLLSGIYILFAIYSGNCYHNSNFGSSLVPETTFHTKPARAAKKVLLFTQPTSSVQPPARESITRENNNKKMAGAAIAQLCSTTDKIANLVAISRCAGLAKKSGASMVSRKMDFSLSKGNLYVVVSLLVFHFFNVKTH
jgi:hypothetical protein